MFAARRPDIPVLFVTGYAGLDALVGSEPERIVQKPLRPEDLAAKALRALRTARHPQGNLKQQRTTG